MEQEVRHPCRSSRRRRAQHRDPGLHHRRVWRIERRDRNLERQDSVRALHGARRRRSDRNRHRVVGCEIVHPREVWNARARRKLAQLAKQPGQSLVVVTAIPQELEEQQVIHR